MNLRPIKQNMTELEVSETLGKKVLFSYRTPVAVVGFDPDAKDFYQFKTDKKWSNTTSRHVTLWFKEMGIESKGVGTKPQEFFDGLVK